MQTAARIRSRAGALRPFRSRSSAPVPPAPAESVPVSGIVEQFSKRLVVGWISVPKGAPPVKVPCT